MPGRRQTRLASLPLAGVLASLLSAWALIFEFSM